LLKDLELARLSLHDKQKVPIPEIEVPENASIVDNVGNVSLLEWLDEDSENEKITLVQSKKKKKKQVKTMLKHPTCEIPIRRSRRNTPFVYRKVEGQELPGPGLNCKKKYR
jgi:hypothetical protein